MGEVWAGVRLSDNSEVAIKVLLAHAVDANEVLARFRREAQVLARVRSKYVAQVLDFLAEEEGFVLVMELIPGESLHAVLSYDKALALETTLDIVSDVLRGLRDLHAANIVHRDLKPGNIVLRPRPGLRPRATLIDFGVSRIMSDSDDDEEVTAITRGDRVLGTLEYMAPEQILGSRSVTGTADLYAVGAMMFRAITGHHVFGDLQEGHLAVAKLNKDAPRLDITRTDEIAERTQVLVSRLLSRRLRERYKTAEEALVEVDAIRALVPGRHSEEATFPGEDEPTLDKPKKVVTVPAETSGSGSPIEILEIRAAVPIEDVQIVQPPPYAPLPDTPMNAEVPRNHREPRPPEGGTPFRTLGIAAVLFLFGSVGGGLFGVSYARGGLAYQMIHSAVGSSSEPVATETPVVSADPSADSPPVPPDAVQVDVAPAGVDDAGRQDAESRDVEVAEAEAAKVEPVEVPPSPPAATPPPTAPPTPVASPQPPPAATTAAPKPTRTWVPKPVPTPKPDPPKEPAVLLPEEP
jgi:serine/threonine-protein kinase